MEELINIKQISPETFETQTYSDKDLNLITSVDIQTQFFPGSDYIEYFVYDLNENIIFANNFGYPNYTILDNQLAIDPESDLKITGFDEGQYNTLYNFLRPLLGSNGSTLYYISEISTNRTEIRLNSTDISTTDIIGSTTEFIEQNQSSSLAYPDFYLNFGYNQLVIANNVLLDDSDVNNPTVLIKLYEPLPQDFSVNTTLWVVEKVAEPKAYNINITTVFDTEDQNIYLKGPNVNLNIKDQINNSTEYGNYSSLSQTTNSQGSGSLQYQINSLLANKGIKINIDYSDYSQFINFSSAQTRLENFYYKLSLIEEYNNSASLSDNTSTNYYVSSSNIIYQNKIDDIITNFDGYEYHLYYTSGSTSWPKTNNTFPYINATTVSTAGQNFLTSQSAVAEYFDDENNNALVNTIPSYLRDDPTNAPYELFVEMVGQNYDSVWVYLKDVTNKFDADNRLNYGISKDLIAQAIRDLGVNIYQNNFSTGDLYSALLGITPSGSLFNLPNTTGSLPTPTGYEYIDTYITASATGSLYPVDDINKSIYKRIYHNLPYLLKKKGTVSGLKSIISLYGIPDTILRVNEFGGKDIDDSDDYDFWQNQYDYKWDTQADGYIESEFALNNSWQDPSGDFVPNTVQFRFKTPGLDSAISSPTQSLWRLDTDVELYLQYTGSGYTSGSYSGSIPNPENEYAKLVLSVNGTTESIYLPFFDGGWWSVAVTKEAYDPDPSLNTFTLLAGNNIYTGEEGSSIGFTGSVSFTEDPSPYISGTTSIFANISTFDKFSGSLQEIRYYIPALSQSVFNDYVMNHNSIEGNSVYQSANQLAFRASLGGELYTGSTSIHPKVTGSSITESFSINSNFNISEGNFTSNEEYVYLDQFPAGIKNRISDKIKQSSIVLPYTGSLSNTIPNTSLSPFIRIQQNTYASESYTHDLDYVEVAFSPQNEINDDIIDSIGYLNIGDYIGDPRQVSSSSETYPQLDTLRDEYFAKYKNEYNIFDYVRLIKYLDNSLFKMLQDFIPARSSLAAGVVIKQHLLERNKFPVPQATYSEDIYTASIEIGEYSAGNGGSMPDLEGEISGSGPGFNIIPITQSWTGSTPSLSGSVEFTNDDQHEFYDGELSGSEFVVTNGELNTECDEFKTPNTTETNYSQSYWTGSNSTWDQAHIYNTQNGKMLIWWAYDTFENDPENIAIRNHYFSIKQISISDTTIQGTNLSNILPQSIKISLPFIDLTQSDVTFNSSGWSGATSAVLQGGPNIEIIAESFQENRAYPGTDNYYLVNVASSNVKILVQQNLFIGYGVGATPSVTPTLSNWNENAVIAIEPFVPASFPVSDCNSILNNAPLNRVSNRYYDVDYSSNAVTAVNERAILNGSAPKANVQNSNYTLLRNINPRYLGTKNTSATLNAIQDDGLASIDQTTSYFLYNRGGNFNQVSDRSGSAHYNIGFLIDELGNVYQPQESESVYLPNLYSGFGRGSKVTFIPVDTGSEVAGTFDVHYPAVKIKPILYSDTGSLGNTYLVSGTINYNQSPAASASIALFQSPEAFTDFNSEVGLTSTQNVLINQTDNLLLTDITSDQEDGWGYNSSGDWSYTVQESSNVSGRFQAQVVVSVDNLISPGATNNDLELQLYKNGNKIAIDQQTNVPPGSFRTFNIYKSLRFTKGDEYVFKFNNSGNAATANTVILAPTFGLDDTLVTTAAEIPNYPAAGSSVNISYANAFTTGQTIDSVLTASQDIAKWYGGAYIQGNNIPGYSFNIPFVFEQYDEVRWNGTEETVSLIDSVEWSSTPALSGNQYEMYIYLTAPIDTSLIDLDYFEFRRNIFQKDSIIVNTPGSVMEKGFILPEYQSPLLKENLSSIIENLTNNGLISTT